MEYTEKDPTPTEQENVSAEPTPASTDAASQGAEAPDGQSTVSPEGRTDAAQAPSPAAPREEAEPTETVYRRTYTPSTTSISYAPETPKKQSHGKKLLAGVLLIAILMGMSMFAGYFMGAGREATPYPNNSDFSASTTAPTPSATTAPRVPDKTIEIPQNTSPVTPAVEGSYMYVHDKAASSVVSITTEATVYSVYTGSYVQSGAGSGVVISRDGDTYYIVTNNHVVDGFTTIKVFSADGGEGISAEVIGSDWTNDIAVLRIVTEQELGVAEIGDSSSLRAGQDVCAIGNPLGTLGGTITSGIISAITREITIEGVTMELMQHSAPVSPGNSGGGLFNMQGQLIGIVNAKSSGESVEGIGFAIPVNTVLRVCREIINQGYASGIPYLGMSFQVQNSNVTINAYEFNHELEASGQRTLQQGDILYQADDIEIRSTEDLRKALSSKEIGEKITLTVYRMTSTGTRFGYTYESFTVEVVIHEQYAG